MCLHSLWNNFLLLCYFLKTDFLQLCICGSSLQTVFIHQHVPAGLPALPPMFVFCQVDQTIFLFISYRFNSDRPFFKTEKNGKWWFIFHFLSILLFVQLLGTFDAVWYLNHVIENFNLIHFTGFILTELVKVFVIEANFNNSWSLKL